MVRDGVVCQYLALQTGSGSARGQGAALAAVTPAPQQPCQQNLPPGLHLQLPPLPPSFLLQPPRPLPSRSLLLGRVDIQPANQETNRICIRVEKPAAANQINERPKSPGRSKVREPIRKTERQSGQVGGGLFPPPARRVGAELLSFSVLPLGRHVPVLCAGGGSDPEGPASQAKKPGLGPCCRGRLASRGSERGGWPRTERLGRAPPSPFLQTHLWPLGSLSRGLVATLGVGSCRMSWLTTKLVPRSLKREARSLGTPEGMPQSPAPCCRN
ncbi:unnamed protein product [Lepidochelys olivacea]